MEMILRSFVEVAPYINGLTNSDFAVSICDLEKCIAYIPGNKINHNIKIGTPHLKGSASYECIIENKKIFKKIDKDVFGFAYIAIAIPLYDAGEVVGSVSFSESIDKQEDLLKISNELYSGITEMSSSTDVMKSESVSIKDICNEMNDSTNDFTNQVEQSDKIINIIKNISSRSNLLGLNASIEAAKIGSAGGGFMVVADEIRKLSNETKDYVKEIEVTLNNIKENSNDLSEKINRLTDIFINQVDAVESINSALLEMNTIAERLKSQAEILNS